MTSTGFLQPSFGSLYLVATPIGNLADMTFRAVDVLKAVDLIAVEDTRHSQLLLNHYGVHTRMLSLHDYNEIERTKMLINRLLEGFDIALISDAGTPLVSDPGYRLVESAHRHGVRVIPVPGACAAIAGLVASGLPTDHFVFAGFLPAKGAAREKQLAAFKEEWRTVIFYESPHRILNLLHLMNQLFDSDRVATIARELTKRFETIRRATVSDLKNWIDKNPEQVRGEFVVLLQGIKKVKEMTQKDKQVLQTLLKELPLKQAVSLSAEITGGKRKAFYLAALEKQKKKH